MKNKTRAFQTKVCARNLGIIVMMAVCLTFAMISCDNGGGGHTHDWGEWNITIAPTCSVTGTGSRVCVSCGETDSNTTIPIAPDAHDYGEWMETTTPTLITEGEQTRTCKDDSTHNETRTFGTLPITTNAEWTTALSQISGKGNAGEYTLTIEGDVGVDGKTANTFGTTASSSLNVTLKGTGKLFLTELGNLIRIGANQTLVIDSEDLTLQGLRNGQNGATMNNNTTVVYVGPNGTLELKNGTISGNTNSVATTSRGGGVFVGTGATFTMYGGVISNNITPATDGQGGGVYVTGGTFRIVTGTIYGSNEVDELKNIAGSWNGGGGGAALWGNAERGTFSGAGGAWVSKDSLTITNDTIKVLNGDIVQ
jgi:hypothetical protein